MPQGEAQHSQGRKSPDKGGRHNRWAGGQASPPRRAQAPCRSSGWVSLDLGQYMAGVNINYQG